MSIELIETIIKMDAGSLYINKYKHIDEFEIKLICRFGSLTANCIHVDEGITQVCKMYQLLEEGNVSVTTVPF